MHEQVVQVECYSGYKADERPVRLKLRDGAREIVAIEDRWYSPGATYFRVLVDDGGGVVAAERPRALQEVADQAARDQPEAGEAHQARMVSQLPQPRCRADRDERQHQARVMRLAGRHPG